MRIRRCLGARMAPGLCLLLFLLTFATTSGPAQVSGSPQVNSWNKPTSGNWEDAASWSLNTSPDSSQSVMITNSGWKAVAINPSTPFNSPGSMTVNDLTIRGAWDTQNVLLLNYLGTAVPLTVLNGLTLQDMAQIVNFDSGLVVQSGTITITNAQIVQDGGYIRTTNATMYLQRAEYNLTNGVFEGGQVVLGYPVSARFNQYAGAVVISNLGFGLGPGSGGTYALYGGYLSLPGGLSITGAGDAVSSYYQAGGTNQTTTIFLEPGYAGISPGFTLDGGVLASHDVSVVGDDFAGANLNQNGGTHIITNKLYLSGGSIHGQSPTPGTYRLNNGVLEAGVIELNAKDGDAVFTQANGITHAVTFYAHSISRPYYAWFPRTTLSGGTLSCSNFSTIEVGGTLTQTGGALVVSNLLEFSAYNFTGGTLTAGNISINGNWIIGDGTTSRISNPGFFSVSGTLHINNAVEQLGRFILAANATIDLAGSASRLSFANSSGETWAGGASLLILNWNGNASGGGAEQLKFGTSASGLTAGQLSQIQFRVGPNVYPAKILASGEVVPDQGSSTSGLVNSWINPASGNWDQAANWSLGVLPDSSQSVFITNSGWKAVAINPSTPVNFPASMTVSNLTIRGAWDTQNVLLLNYLGVDVPLTVLNGLTLQDMAQIVNFNSGLVVQSGAIMVTNSQIIQDGGFVRTTNAPMYLQRAEYNLTNGVFEAGTVNLGLPVFSTFNQYGGSAVISDLYFGQTLSFGAGGHYALYGGYLSLPNGLGLISDGNSAASYFQSGGSNQTTRVYLSEGGAQITLNGGLLADTEVNVVAGRYGHASIEQNGGAHVITNQLSIVGGAANGYTVVPATYNLNGGTLSAGLIELGADSGDSVFVQSNGTASAETIYAHSLGYYSSHNTIMTLAGGTLTCSKFTTIDGGGSLTQSGGALIVTNLLDFGGARYVGGGRTIYGYYTFTGGTLSVSNINMSGTWIIGDGSTKRISNPGFFSLSHLLQISNAVEQLGRFILASSNATINLAGNTSQLSFANSSGEAWAAGATLVVANWNGNPSGGGAEQLRFGTDQSGLSAAQLSQIRFGSGTNVYPAKILSTGEVVPDQAGAASVAFSRQGNKLVLTWPSGWSLQAATNVVGPYLDVPGATSPYTNDLSLPQQFFRLGQ